MPLVADLHVGSALADYRIEELVARGGMGAVYKARQVSNERIIALKVILPELSDNAAFRERFEHESRIAIALEHPHVVPVYATGEAEGVLYMAMRFVNGVDLRRLITSSGLLRPERAVEIVEQVASGLDAAHRMGLIHRDVKPANVMVEMLGDRDHCYIMDFGLAKQSGSTGFTRSGSWVGTLDYVAPEQILAEGVDWRADVYALGGVLYHALVGEPPYPVAHEAAKLHAHLNSEVPRPSVRRSDLPEVFDDVIARALAKDKNDRYLSAGDLGRAARAALTGRSAAIPERRVATGEAASGLPSSRSGVSRSVGGITRFDQTVGDSRVLPPGPPRSRRKLFLVASVVALGAAAAAVALIIGASGSKLQAQRAASAGNSKSATSGINLHRVSRPHRAHHAATPRASQPAAPSIDKSVVSPDGNVGTLVLNKATTSDVIRAEGTPELQSTGNFAPSFPSYTALGYNCAGATTATSCKAIFYISQQTGLLTSFYATDPTYHTPNGSHAGDSLATAERLEGRTVAAGCITGIVESSAAATLALYVRAHYHGSTITGGRVASLSLEAKHGSVGIQFC